MTNVGIGAAQGMNFWLFLRLAGTCDCFLFGDFSVCFFLLFCRQAGGLGEQSAQEAGRSAPRPIGPPGWGKKIFFGGGLSGSAPRPPLRGAALPVAVRLLHPASGGRALAGGFGGELLAGRLATGGLAGGLLGTGHAPADVAALHLPGGT